jgi:predicted transcriptional regulator
MADAQKVDRGLVVAIVRSYVAKKEIAADQLGGLIYNRSPRAQQPRHGSAAAHGGRVDPGGPDPAIRAAGDHVVCLECGFRGQTLRRHLRGFRCRYLSDTLEIAAGSPGAGTR